METLANRNNNPGNIKDVSTGQFKTYATPQEGYAALLNDLEIKKSGKSRTGLKSDQTLADFAKVYAPDTDNNNPAQYTANIANHMGVRPDAKISELDTGKWAEAIANAEGYKGNTSKREVPTTQTARKTFEDITQENKAPDPDAPVKEEHGAGLAGFGGKLVSGFIKPYARLATNLVNTGQVIANKPLTKPFSGKFLGDVTRVGEGIQVGENPLSKENKKAIKDSVGVGLRVGSDIATPKLISGLLSKFGKSSSALKNPEIVRIIRQGVQTRQGAIDRLGTYLRSTPLTKLDKGKDKLILRAIEELNPTSVEKQGMLLKLAKGGYDFAKNIALVKLLGGTVGGLVDRNTK